MSAAVKRTQRSSIGALRRAADAAGYASAFAIDDAPRSRSFLLDPRTHIASGAFVALAGCVALLIVM